jgi:hypothetical protein
MQYFRQWATPGSPNLNTGLGFVQNSVPVVGTATAATQRVTVWINNNACHDGGSYQVPIPAGLWPEVHTTSSYTESQMAVMESDTGVEWDMFQLSSPGDRRLYAHGTNLGCPTNEWSASMVSKLNPGWNGTGYNSGPWGGHGGSGMFSGSGVVRARDARLPAGSTWDHALALAYLNTSNGTVNPSFVPPARGGDGTCDYGRVPGAGCIPEGARIQLDPSINCATWPSLQASPYGEWAKQLCRTLQQYGMIVVDTGGGLLNEHHNSYDLGMSGYDLPWYNAGSPKLPTDLLPYFRVIDWTRWN